MLAEVEGELEVVLLLFPDQLDVAYRHASGEEDQGIVALAEGFEARGYGGQIGLQVVVGELGGHRDALLSVLQLEGL